MGITRAQQIHVSTCPWRVDFSPLPRSPVARACAVQLLCRRGAGLVSGFHHDLSCPGHNSLWAQVPKIAIVYSWETALSGLQSNCMSQMCDSKFLNILRLYSYPQNIHNQTARAPLLCAHPCSTLFQLQAIP